MDTFKCKPTSIHGVWEVAKLEPPFKPITYYPLDVRIYELAQFLDRRVNVHSNYSLKDIIGADYWHADTLDPENTHFLLCVMNSTVGTQIARNQRYPDAGSIFRAKPWTVYLLDKDIIHRGAPKPRIKNQTERRLCRVALKLGKIK